MEELGGKGGHSQVFLMSVCDNASVLLTPAALDYDGKGEG